MLKDFLESLDFEVFEAINGQDALCTIRDQAPHVLFVDVYMPVMSGFEMIRLLRQDPESRAIPAIAVSANVSEHTRQKCMDTGFDAFLPKPIKTEQILQLLERYLPLTWLYAPGEQGTPSDRSAGAENGVIPPWKELQDLSRQAMRGNLKEIRYAIEALEHAHPEYAPFLQQMHEWLDGFHIQQIQQYVKNFLEERG